MHDSSFQRKQKEITMISCNHEKFAFPNPKISISSYLRTDEERSVFERFCDLRSSVRYLLFKIQAINMIGQDAIFCGRGFVVNANAVRVRSSEQLRAKNF